MSIFCSNVYISFFFSLRGGGSGVLCKINIFEVWKLFRLFYCQFASQLFGLRLQSTIFRGNDDAVFGFIQNADNIYIKLHNE